MTPAQEAKERLRAAYKLLASLESVGAMVSVADLDLIVASHDALEEALAKANKPRWFYADDEGSPFDSVHEVVEAILDEFGPEDHFPNGKGVLPIETARVGPLIYAAVRILTEAERPPRKVPVSWPFEVTECATEAEAWAELKEGDQ
jgi:hypothetical protein